MNTENTLSTLKHSINNGTIYGASIDELKRYNSALCHSQAYTFFGNHQFPRICKTIDVMLINAHVDLFQKHITELNLQNTKTQRYFLALTIASLASSFLTYYFNLK